MRHPYAPKLPASYEARIVRQLHARRNERALVSLASAALALAVGAAVFAGITLALGTVAAALAHALA